MRIVRLAALLPYVIGLLAYLIPSSVYAGCCTSGDGYSNCCGPCCTAGATSCWAGACS